MYSSIRLMLVLGVAMVTSDRRLSDSPPQLPPKTPCNARIVALELSSKRSENGAALQPVKRILDKLKKQKQPDGSHRGQAKPASLWNANYAKAMSMAEQQGKMLLVYFCDACGDQACNRFKTETLDDAQVQKKLQAYVCVQVPLDAKITVGGKPVTLLEHPSFSEMLGKPGVAIVDFRHHDPKLYGAVVSQFPITETLWYTREQMAVILDLPPGTLTQRTLIYAVRVHPEKPASTDSAPNDDLLEEAQSHSQYQADIRLQGHHSWDSRFQRIIARLPDGETAREVCAESWPGENLVEAAIECVRCWRMSSGHWGAVSASNRCFGYDMKRGGNGIWYATGIFGLR
jgi:hypothetical protein